jgi:acyl-CoA hydrolase
MEDPSDAFTLTEKDYDQVHHFFDIPELGENILENFIEIKLSARSKSVFNSPTGSWMQVFYPFAEKEELANKYVKFTDGEIMIGKMLEEIDVISAETAFRYIRERDDAYGVSTVTAAVDHLEFNTPITIYENLKINSYVIYAGSSTIYVKSDMYYQRPGEKNWHNKGYTIFIMAARKDNKAYQIPQLEFTGENDESTARTREMLGKELKEYIVGLNNDLYKQAPNKSEAILIHDLFKRLKFEKKSDIVTVSDTVIAHNSVTKMQEKNTYGKVFGGYLMHRA